jgi:hypothetical protein
MKIIIAWRHERTFVLVKEVRWTSIKMHNVVLQGLSARSIKAIGMGHPMKHLILNVPFSVICERQWPCEPLELPVAMHNANRAYRRPSPKMQSQKTSSSSILCSTFILPEDASTAAAVPTAEGAVGWLLPATSSSMNTPSPENASNIVLA